MLNLREPKPPTVGTAGVYRRAGQGQRAAVEAKLSVGACGLPQCGNCRRSWPRISTSSSTGRSCRCRRTARRGSFSPSIALVVAYFWRNDPTVLNVSLWIAGVLALVSLSVPILLRPLNIVWMRFALLLSKVMNPIVMFLLFLVAIVPAGLLMQIGYDPLRRTPGRQATAIGSSARRITRQHDQSVLSAAACRWRATCCTVSCTR